DDCVFDIRCHNLSLSRERLIPALTLLLFLTPRIRPDHRNRNLGLPKLRRHVSREPAHAVPSHLSLRPLEVERISVVEKDEPDVGRAELDLDVVGYRQVPRHIKTPQVMVASVAPSQKASLACVHIFRSPSYNLFDYCC